MNLINIKYKANYYALLLLAFLIPLERRLISPVIIIFLITSFLNGNFKRLKNKKVLYFSLLYVLYVFGLFYSDNFETGSKDLMIKLSLVIFPVAFLFSKLRIRECLGSVLKSFIEGCFVSSFIAIIVSVINYHYQSNISLFFYDSIALFGHSSYLAMLLSLSILALFINLISKKPFLKMSSIISFFLIAYFSFFIVLLSSKTGLISLILIHGTVILFLIFKYKAYVKGISISLFLAVSLLLAYNYSNLFKERIDEIIKVTQSETVENSTTGARKSIWITAIELIKKEPILGYGTGDAKDVLVNEYKNKGLDYLYSQALNAHNQFLQTGLALGLLGLILLMSMLGIPLYFSIKKEAYLYVGFLILMSINFFTEAMLERQVGVVFYSFFNSLFFITYFGPKILDEKG